VPLVSTIHGRQVRNSIWKRNDIYGERMVAVCSNLSDHLEHEMGFDPARIVTIPNGFDVERLKTYQRDRPSGGGFVISVIGRFMVRRERSLPGSLKRFFRSAGETSGSFIHLVGGQWDELPGEGRGPTKRCI